MRKTLLFLILMTVLVGVGCGGFIKGKAAADQSVADFHKLYNEGKFSEVYSASHPAFRGVTSEKQFQEFAEAVRRKLGKATGTSNAGFNVWSMNLTTKVVLTQATTFEHGTGTEVFTFEMKGEKALLVGYNINSKDFILK